MSALTLGIFSQSLLGRTFGLILTHAGQTYLLVGTITGASQGDDRIDISVETVDGYRQVHYIRVTRDSMEIVIADQPASCRGDTIGRSSYHIQHFAFAHDHDRSWTDFATRLPTSMREALGENNPFQLLVGKDRLRAIVVNQTGVLFRNPVCAEHCSG